MSELISVELNKIEVDNEFNSRKKYERIEELARDIKSQGQITPGVARPTGKSDVPYYLVAGRRRYEALKLLDAARKPNSAPVTMDLVVRHDMDGAKEAFLLNLTENLARDELTSYEVARAVKSMADDYHMGPREVSARLNVSKGFSRQNVGNMIRALNNLPKPILVAWEGDSPVCTLKHIIKWSAMTQDEAMEAYEVEAGLTAPVVAGEAGIAPEARQGRKRVSKVKIEDALTVCRALDKDGVEGAGYVVATLKWILGYKDSPVLKMGDTVFFDPTPVKDVDEDND